MTDMVSKSLTFAPTPLADINMGLVGHFVSEYRNGNSYLTPNQIAVAKAAIALQEAYARKEYHITSEDSDFGAEREEYNRASDCFNGGHLRRGVMWGVARHQLPLNTNPGEYVTIHYKSLNEMATAAGFVIAERTYPQGKGVIIRLMETNNGFNISTGGWRYISLWIPSDRSKMAGFLF